MLQYDQLAIYWDDVFGVPARRAQQILDLLHGHTPGPVRMLDLGSGTGQISALLLQQWPGWFSDLVGIDTSAAMVEIANERGLAATYLQADITDFELDRTFDVAVCVGDTINHLLDPGLWHGCFTSVARHLADDGLLLFDLNTLGRLKSLAQAEPVEIPLRTGHATMLVVPTQTENVVQWQITVPDLPARIEICELGLPLREVERLLAPHYTVLSCTENGETPATENSPRAIFLCRRR